VCDLLQSATHVFVVCLAVSDLALCLFSLPVQLHYQLTDNWYLGSALCRVIFAAFAVPMYLSTVTIMLIAVDRWAHLHASRQRRSNCTQFDMLWVCCVAAKQVVQQAHDKSKAYTSELYKK